MQRTQTTSTTPRQSINIFLTLALVTILLSVHVNTKQIQSLILMSQFEQNQGWIFLGKMALSQGTANVKITTEKISGTPRNSGGQLVINFVSDAAWKVQSEKKCLNPLNSPILTHQLLLQGSLSISQHTVKIADDQLYYFVLKDCGKKFQTDYTNFQLSFKLKMQVVNNGAYMGQQQDHWYIVPVIIGLGLWLIMSDKYFLRGQFQRDPDYAKMILFGAIATNISSLMWRSFGYLIYRNFGSNYLLFHIIYLFMHSVSQTMVLSLLVLVSMGWSLNYLQGPQLDIAIPLISFIAMMNIILSLMTQISNSSHDMHHTFDAYTGSILIIVRILIGIGFLISVIITIKKSRYRIRQFMKIFGMLGLLYIVSMPLVVLTANNTIQAKHRNQFVFICVEVIKSVCNIALMYMVSSSRSEYNKLCYKNASFLPSETGLF